MPNLPAAETNTEPPCGTISQGNHPATRGQVDNHFYHWRNSIFFFFFTGTDILDTDLLFLFAMLLPKLPSEVLQNALPTTVIFQIALLLVKKLISQEKKFNNEPVLMKYTGVPHHPEAGTLIEQSSENSVTVLASWQYLAGLGQGSPEGCVCSKSMLKIWCCFSHTQDHGSRNQGAEQAPFTITLMTC